MQVVHNEIYGNMCTKTHIYLFRKYVAIQKMPARVCFRGALGIMENFAHQAKHELLLLHQNCTQLKVDEWHLSNTVVDVMLSDSAKGFCVQHMPQGTINMFVACSDKPRRFMVSGTRLTNDKHSKVELELGKDGKVFFFCCSEHKRCCAIMQRTQALNEHNIHRITKAFVFFSEIAADRTNYKRPMFSLNLKY